VDNSQIIIYQTENGQTKIDVKLENETVWLTQKLMAELFQTTPQNITIHLKNIFEILKKNVEINKLNDKIIPINKNIKSIEGEYDFIFSNPPYKKINSGKMPRNEAERVSKYEVLLTLEELILGIKRLLKNHGEFFVIVPNDRLNDVFKNIYVNKMNILSIDINKYKKMDLVVVHGKKGGKSNSKIMISL